MVWLRLHTDILGDPKLIRATREGAKCLYLTPWLLAFAKQADDGGRLSVGGVPAEPRDIARLIPNTTAREVEKCAKALQGIGVLVIDEYGILKFPQWETRQSKPSATPAAVTQRVRKHRQAKEEREKGAENETPSGVFHTPPNETPPEERRGEEKRGEEKRGVLQRDPKAGAPDGAPEVEAPELTPQELLERKERFKAGIRELQEAEAKK